MQENHEPLWKSSRFAALIMVLVMLAGTYIGAARSLGRERARVENMFYSGQGGFCIQNDLDERIISATNYLTLARRYLPEDNAALRGVAQAASELSNAQGIRDKYDANASLSSAAAYLEAELEKQALTERDKSYARSIPADMESRNDTMSRDPYNQIAGEYNEVLSRFPANLLSTVTGVEKAELFR